MSSFGTTNSCGQSYSSGSQTAPAPPPPTHHQPKKQTWRRNQFNIYLSEGLRNFNETLQNLEGHLVASNLMGYLSIRFRPFQTVKQLVQVE
jgi:hypothetical protein